MVILEVVGLEEDSGVLVVALRVGEELRGVGDCFPQARVDDISSCYNKKTAGMIPPLR